MGPLTVAPGATVQIETVSAKSQQACRGKRGVAAFAVGMPKGGQPGPDTVWQINLTPPVQDTDQGVIWHTILEPASHLVVLELSSREDGP